MREAHCLLFVDDVFRCANKLLYLTFPKTIYSQQPIATACGDEGTKQMETTTRMQRAVWKLQEASKQQAVQQLDLAIRMFPHAKDVVFVINKM